MTMRIRETIAPDGISAAAAARKYERYGLNRTTLRGWVDAGQIAVVREPAAPGDAKLLDDADIQRLMQKNYKPHADNKGRKTRTRTVIDPAPTYTPVPYQPYIGNTPQPTTPEPYNRQPVRAPAVQMTAHWVTEFVLDRKTRAGGELRPATAGGYKTILGRFQDHFEQLPLEDGNGPPVARRIVLDYLLGLKTLTGGPVDENTRHNHLRGITALYNWLKREHGFNSPNLTDSGIMRHRGITAVAMYWDETREILRNGCRNASEYDLILLLAQTGCRISELHTIRPETMKDHHCMVWGKPTKTNKSGQRPLAIPDEAWDRLMVHFDKYGELCWVDAKGVPHPLAGPMTESGRGAINLRDEDTYIVQPLPGAKGRTTTQINRMSKAAGVWVPGKTAHAFRRGYQAEFTRNGGSHSDMRLIMGHFELSDMDDLYTHSKIEDWVKAAREFAPRKFLTDDPAEDNAVTDKILADLPDFD